MMDGLKVLSTIVCPNLCMPAFSIDHGKKSERERERDAEGEGEGEKECCLQVRLCFLVEQLK